MKAPTSITVTARRTDALIEWTGDEGAYSYTVEVREPNGTWVVQRSKNFDRKLGIAGLEPGREYEVRVTCAEEFGTGMGARSDVRAFTTEA